MGGTYKSFLRIKGHELEIIEEPAWDIAKSLPFPMITLLELENGLGVVTLFRLEIRWWAAPMSMS